jgi:hypothetical protein
MVDVPVTDRLELLIRRHEEELRKLAGEASLCAVSRAGKAVPAIKYQEGSTAVLRELRRRVESGSDWESATDEVRQRLIGQASLAARSADWFAYVEGGSDALAELGV